MVKQVYRIRVDFVEKVDAPNLKNVTEYAESKYKTDDRAISKFLIERDWVQDDEEVKKI